MHFLPVQRGLRPLKYETWNVSFMHCAYTYIWTIVHYIQKKGLTGVLLFITPVAAAVMQYIMKVLGRRVEAAKKLPVLPHSSAVTIHPPALPKWRLAALQEQHISVHASCQFRSRICFKHLPWSDVLWYVGIGTPVNPPHRKNCNSRLFAHSKFETGEAP